MLKITERPMTVKDFLKLKKTHVGLAALRQLGKTINFSLIFGCSATRFAQELRENLTDEEIYQIVRDLGLTKSVKKIIDRAKDNNKPMSEKSAHFLAAAQFMRSTFFETYKGLAERITREFTFTREHGYTRAFHGPIRHNPILTLMSFDEQGYPTGADKEFGLLASNCKNISANTTIQTFEAFIVMVSFHQIHTFLTKKWNLKSRIFNTTHDSIDFFLFHDEVELVLALVQHICCRIREPFDGIPMTIDADVSDLRNPDHYYKHGDEVRIKTLEQALAEYNAAHGTNLIYEDMGL